MGPRVNDQHRRGYKIGLILFSFFFFFSSSLYTTVLCRGILVSNNQYIYTHILSLLEGYRMTTLLNTRSNFFQLRTVLKLSFDIFILKSEQILSAI